MANYNFFKDIPIGEEAQREAIPKIKSYYPKISIIVEHNKTEDYDILGILDGKHNAVEIKRDIEESKTGNVSIEDESR